MNLEGFTQNGHQIRNLRKIWDQTQCTKLIYDWFLVVLCLFDVWTFRPFGHGTMAWRGTVAYSPSCKSTSPRFSCRDSGTKIVASRNKDEWPRIVPRQRHDSWPIIINDIVSVKNMRKLRKSQKTFKNISFVPRCSPKMTFLMRSPMCHLYIVLYDLWLRKTVDL